MGWLLGFFNSPIGQRILFWIGSKIWKAIWDGLVRAYTKIKRSIINLLNVKDYKKKVNGPVEQEIAENGPQTAPDEFSPTPTKDEEEIMQSGQDLLNGKRRRL